MDKMWKMTIVYCKKVMENKRNMFWHTSCRMSDVRLVKQVIFGITNEQSGEEDHVEYSDVTEWHSSDLRILCEQARYEAKWRLVVQCAVNTHWHWAPGAEEQEDSERSGKFITWRVVRQLPPYPVIKSHVLWGLDNRHGRSHYPHRPCITSKEHIAPTDPIMS